MAVGWHVIATMAGVVGSTAIFLYGLKCCRRKVEDVKVELEDPKGDGKDKRR